MNTGNRLRKAFWCPCSLLHAPGSREALAPTRACASSTGYTKKERGGSRNHKGSSSPGLGASRLTCSTIHTRPTKPGEAQSYSVSGFKAQRQPSEGQNPSCLQLWRKWQLEVPAVAGWEDYSKIQFIFENRVFPASKIKANPTKACLSHLSGTAQGQ